jgi:hypothetical protein
MFKIRAVDIFEDFVECCGVKLDLKSRMVILHTLMQKTWEVKVYPWCVTCYEENYVIYGMAAKL